MSMTSLKLLLLFNGHQLVPLSRMNINEDDTFVEDIQCTLVLGSNNNNMDDVTDIALQHILVSLELIDSLGWWHRLLDEAEIDNMVFTLFNPRIRQWAVDPNVPHDKAQCDVICHNLGVIHYKTLKHELSVVHSCNNASLLHAIQS